MQTDSLFTKYIPIESDTYLKNLQYLRETVITNKNKYKDLHLYVREHQGFNGKGLGITVYLDGKRDFTPEELKQQEQEQREDDLYWFKQIAEKYNLIDINTLKQIE